MARADQVRNQLNEWWNQAIGELEEVKDALARSRDRWDEYPLRLRKERDRLLKMLGEQTYKLANQGKLPVPEVIKKTVERLNDVIESLVEQEQKSREETKTSKKAAKKATKKTGKRATKKTGKKTTKKTSKKTGKKTAKKTTKKTGAKKTRGKTTIAKKKSSRG